MILEKDDEDEAGVEQDLLKNPGLLNENCHGHHPLGGNSVYHLKFPCNF